jgi:hypothetical protein
VGRALAHTPLVDVIVNDSKSPTGLMKRPTAVQFPGDPHDTDFNSENELAACTPAPNTAGAALAHTPLVDVMVNESRRPAAFTKYPTAVQFPADAHDTELMPAVWKLARCTPAPNTAGAALAHTPLVDVMVNACASPATLL